MSPNTQSKKDSRAITRAMAVSFNKHNEKDDAGKVQVSKSKFTECKARFGGGIRANHITKDGITDSTFKSCISLLPNNHSGNQQKLFDAFSGGSIFARDCDGLERFNTPTSQIISKCSIESGSISLGNFYSYEQSGNIRCHNTVTCSISMENSYGYIAPITKISDEDLQKLIDHKTLESIKNFSTEIQ